MNVGAGLSADVAGGVAGEAPKENGDFAGAAEAVVVELPVFAAPNENAEVPPNSGLGAWMAGALVVEAGAVAGGWPKVKDGFADSVVPDAVLPNPPKLDDDPPKRGGLGASAAGAGVGSAGFGCSLGCPKVKAPAGEAGFAGVSMLAGGPNVDGAAPSATLDGGPKLNALVVDDVVSAGLAGAPKLNGEVDVALAASALVADSTGLVPKREAPVDDASAGFAGAPDETVAPVETGCSIGLAGTLPKTEVGAVVDVALASGVALSLDAAVVPVAVPKGDANKFVELPDELAFTSVDALDEPNNDCLGASFGSEGLAAGARAGVDAPAEEPDEVAVVAAPPKSDVPVGSVICGTGFARIEEFAKKLGIFSVDASGSFAGWGVAGINSMLGTDCKTGVAGAVAVVGGAGPAAIVGTIVAGSWFAGAKPLGGRSRSWSTGLGAGGADWAPAAALDASEVGWPNENGRDAIGGSLDALELSLIGAVCRTM